MSNNCTHLSAECTVQDSKYGYTPNLAANVVFMIIFGTAASVNSIQGVRWKTWFYTGTMVLGSMTESIGYIGRIMMHTNVYNLAAFLIQICCLTLAPAFYSAALYVGLSKVVVVYGEQLSRIPAPMYSYIFIFCDFISLSLQGAGGGIAASTTEPSMMKVGDNLMLAGLVFQVFTLALFAILCAEFAFRACKSATKLAPEYELLRSSKRFRGFLIGMIVAYSLILTRCIYRVVELGAGWGNSLMKQEVPFVILEGVAISIAVFMLSCFHPGFAFSDEPHLINTKYTGVGKHDHPLIEIRDNENVRREETVRKENTAAFGRY